MGSCLRRRGIRFLKSVICNLNSLLQPGHALPHAELEDHGESGSDCAPRFAIRPRHLEPGTSPLSPKHRFTAHPGQCQPRPLPRITRHLRTVLRWPTRCPRTLSNAPPLRKSHNAPPTHPGVNAWTPLFLQLLIRTAGPMAPLPLFFVDNVVTTGSTLRAARAALGWGPSRP
jgi:hypothetical protein